MKSRRWSTIGTVIVGVGLSHCVSSPETGDETHFWCSSDAQCERLGEGYVCRRNESEQRGECQLASAATLGSGGGPDAGDGGQTGSGGDDGGADNTGGQTPSGGTSGGSGATSSGGQTVQAGGAGGGSGGSGAAGARSSGGSSSFPPNVPDPSPYPTVDCNTTWPANTARFDTTAGLVGTPDIKVYDKGPVGILVNRNGTAVVAFFPTHADGTVGGEDLIQGHVMRWAGDTVSRLGQPEGEGLWPLAVDCAATTIVGKTYHPTVPIRWKAESGFETLPAAAVGSVAGSGTYAVIGVSPDGATAFGTYTVAGSPPVVVRWQGGAAEPLFTLPNAGDTATFFSRDGTTLLGETESGQVLLRPLSGTTVTPAIPTILNTRAISGDGRVVAGLLPSESADPDAVRAFVWSASGGLEILPPYTVITPNRVAVGYQTGILNGPIDLVWDAKHGVRLLRDVLAAHGVTVPADVSILNTHAISDDGRVIVAFCTDASDPLSSHLCRAILPANAFD